MFVDAGFSIVCCFNGMAGPLKQNQAYLSRYGKNVELAKEMEDLYNVETFPNVEA